MQTPTGQPAEGKRKKPSIYSFIWSGTLRTERPNGSFLTQVGTINIFLPVISWPPQYPASIPYGCTSGCWFLLRCARQQLGTSEALTLSPNTIHILFF